MRRHRSAVFHRHVLRRDVAGRGQCLDEALRWHRLEFADLFGLHSDPGEKHLGCHGRVGDLRRGNRGLPQCALDNRAVKQPLRRRHAVQNRRLAAASGLAENRHERGRRQTPRCCRAPIPAPGQILHADVARLPEVPADLREVEEAEHVEAVRHGDDDDAVFLREGFSFVEHRVAGARAEAAAMKPDHHGLAPVTRRGGRPHVKEKAVLTHRPWTNQCVSDRRHHAAERLRRPRPVGGRVPNPGPRLGLDRWQEPRGPRAHAPYERP